MTTTKIQIRLKIKTQTPKISAIYWLLPNLESMVETTGRKMKESLKMFCVKTQWKKIF